MSLAENPNIPAVAIVNAQITHTIGERIHKAAEKYGCPQGLEQEMRTLYKLEKQMEFIDNESNPTHSFSFQERAAAHFEISRVESVHMHNIENIFAKEGRNEAERNKLARNITKLMVKLAWDNPNNL